MAESTPNRGTERTGFSPDRGNEPTGFSPNRGTEPTGFSPNRGIERTGFERSDEGVEESKDDQDGFFSHLEKNESGQSGGALTLA